MKVTVKNDEIKKVLKHPVAGAFREDGTADWPDDSFTARRIADGDITVTEEKKAKPEEKAEEKAAEEKPHDQEETAPAPARHKR